MQVQQRGRPMPFTEEQMRQIYNTNIIDFAVRNGFEIEKSDKATVHVKHNGGLYLFKHGRGYYSFTEERGGDIVEFAMNYLGLKKREAMEQILGCRAYERTAHVVSPQAKVYQSRQEIGGKVRRNCAFVGYDSKGTPRYCALRGPSAGSSFRQDMENSDKTYGFLMEGKSNRVYEFEAPIDAMSHATLYKLRGYDWRKDYRISEGCLSDRALKRFLEEHPKVNEIVFCYDNDVDGKLADGTPHNHGQVRAGEAKKHYQSLGYKVAIQTPTEKDFNKVLTSLYEQPRQQQSMTEDEEDEEGLGR